MIFDIKYNIVENELTVVNISEKVQHLQVWIIDLDTNLNVMGWWNILKPSDNVVWKLPIEYYKILFKNGGFKVICTEIGKDKIFEGREFKSQRITKRYFFNTKSPSDLNYWAWHVLKYQPEFLYKLRSNDIVYDLGAHIGSFIMFALERNVKKIYAFEPDPENYFCMRKTFLNNPNVFIIEKAILDTERIEKFHILPHSVSNSFFAISDKTIDVECINLEKYVIEKNLDLPTIIKCDIEGSEYEFMKQTTNNFFSNVRLFLLEYHYKNLCNFSHVSEIIKRFLNLGFSVKKGKTTDLYSDNPDSIGSVMFERLV